MTPQLKKLITIVNNKGGRFISDIAEYKNTSSRLVLQCCHKHNPWEVSARKIIYENRWCPTCAGNQYDPHGKWKKIIQTAEARGGKILSPFSLNYSATSKIVMRCEKNHQWTATIDGLLNRNRWCAECSRRGRGEKIVRGWLEAIYQTDFPNVRPKWNINPHTKSLLELDCYSSNLKIAVEYDGSHHYKIIRGHTLKELEDIQMRDAIKEENCKALGVTLYRITDLPDYQLTNFTTFFDHFISTFQNQGLVFSISESLRKNLEEIYTHYIRR